MHLSFDHISSQVNRIELNIKSYRNHREESLIAIESERAVTEMLAQLKRIKKQGFRFG
jgi:predicted RNA-binding protein Jag